MGPLLLAGLRVGALQPVRIQTDPSPPDSVLMQRLLQGDRGAEEILYRRHFAVVFGTARRLLGNSADAEDVTQDTFVTAFAIAGQLREPERTAPWLLRIAVRNVHRRFRRRRLLRSLGLDRSIDDAALQALAPSGTGAEVRAELALLDGVLARLAAPARIAWMLRQVEGWSLEEVAAQCGCSLATAKRRIAAAQTEIAGHVRWCEVSDD